jgi:hypothetical protein
VIKPPLDDKTCETISFIIKHLAYHYPNIERSEFFDRMQESLKSINVDSDPLFVERLFDTSIHDDDLQDKIPVLYNTFSPNITLKQGARNAPEEGQMLPDARVESELNQRSLRPRPE